MLEQWLLYPFTYYAITILVLHHGCYRFYGGYRSTIAALPNCYSLYYSNTMKAMLLLSLHFWITTVHAHDLLVILLSYFEWYQIYSNYLNYSYYYQRYSTISILFLPDYNTISPPILYHCIADILPLMLSLLWSLLQLYQSSHFTIPYLFYCFPVLFFHLDHPFYPYGMLFLLC